MTGTARIKPARLQAWLRLILKVLGVVCLALSLGCD
jgi:hypothetical protein